MVAIVTECRKLGAEVRPPLEEKETGHPMVARCNFFQVALAHCRWPLSCAASLPGSLQLLCCRLMPPFLWHCRPFLRHRCR